MIPYYFGKGDTSLFSCYHPPSISTSARTGILICYPIGHEYIRSHRLLRQLSKLLSRMGIHVFRFDYFGTGDSIGGFDQARLDRWVKDTLLALDEFKAMSNAQEFHIMGLRFGANITALSSKNTTGVKSLILCDPIMNCKEYLDQLKTLHSQMLRDQDRFSKPRQANDLGQHNLLGFDYSLGLRQDIQNLSVQTSLMVPIKKHFLLSGGVSHGNVAAYHLNAYPGTQSTHKLATDFRWHQLEHIESGLVVPELIDILKAIVNNKTP